MQPHIQPQHRASQHQQGQSAKTFKPRRSSQDVQQDIQMEYSFEYRLKSILAGLQARAAYQYGLLAALTVLAAVLRFYKLGQWSFWIDEIYSINRAQIHFQDPLVVIQTLPTRLWLPLSLITTKVALNVFGVTEWSARLASALIGIVSVPVLYVATRKLFGTGVALIVSLLLTMSPWHLYWSQNARFYTSLLLLYTLAALVFYIGIERDWPLFFVLFYVLFYFALSERLVAVFLLPVCFLYLALLWLLPFGRPPGLRLRNLFIMAAPIGLILLFEYTRYLSTGSSITIDVFNDFLGIRVGDPFRLFLAIVFNLSISIFTLGLVSAAYLLAKRNRAGLFLLLAALLPVLLLVMLNPFMFTKDRYVFMTLPCWLILAALGIRELLSHSRGMAKLLALGLAAILVAESAGSQLLYYFANNGNRLDWRTAFQTVEMKSRADDVVVAWWPEFGPFYLDRAIIPWKDVSPESVIEDRKRHWFIVDSETIWNNARMKEWIEKHGQLINLLYLRLPEGNFYIRIYLYDPAAAQ